MCEEDGLLEQLATKEEAQNQDGRKAFRRTLKLPPAWNR
jgi:hypothetical protein